MKGLTLVVVMTALVIGCNGSSDTDADKGSAGESAVSKGSEEASKPKTTDTTAKSTSGGSGAAAPTAAPTAAPAYEEITKDGKIYVVASKASADKVRAGQKLTPTVTAFGFGPQGEKVYFETDKEGKLDQVLMVEYNRRHAK